MHRWIRTQPTQPHRLCSTNAAAWSAGVSGSSTSIRRDLHEQEAEARGACKERGYGRHVPAAVEAVAAEVGKERPEGALSEQRECDGRHPVLPFCGAVAKNVQGDVPDSCASAVSYRHRRVRKLVLLAGWIYREQEGLQRPGGPADYSHKDQQ